MRIGGIGRTPVGVLGLHMLPSTKQFAYSLKNGCSAPDLSHCTLPSQKRTWQVPTQQKAYTSSRVMPSATKSNIRRARVHYPRGDLLV